jgi:hypothetical protein
MTQAIDTWQDWKFGLITREIYRVSEDQFEIHDTSDGWNVAIVSKAELADLLNGKMSLRQLDWE